MKAWECKRCGKCCLTIPCIFAQVKYNIHKGDRKKCPSLVREETGYKCKLIEIDTEVRETLCSGDCDDPDLAHLKKKFKASEVVREYFPDIEEDDISYILWNYTGFPEFWNIPEDGWTPLQCLRKQLNEFKLLSLQETNKIT